MTQPSGALTAPFTYAHPDYGSVIVTPRRNMKRLVGRRRSDGTFTVTAPYGLPLNRLIEAMESLLPRLAKLSSDRHYELFSGACRFDYPEGSITIDRHLQPGMIGACARGDGIRVFVAPDLDLSSPEVQSAAGKVILNVARYHTQRLVIPRAKATAARLGIGPVTWLTGKATGQLGCCYRQGRRIRLSALLLLLPAELRELVICHELAHLTHHDHSAAFHALCNTYCDGREKELNHALKQFRWPFPLR